MGVDVDVGQSIDTEEDCEYYYQNQSAISNQQSIDQHGSKLHNLYRNSTRTQQSKFLNLRYEINNNHRKAQL